MLPGASAYREAWASGAAGYLDRTYGYRRIEYNEGRYRGIALPFLGENRFFRPGDYFMALDPCNNHIRGALWEREEGLPVFSPPPEKACRLYCVSIFLTMPMVWRYSKGTSVDELYCFL